MGIAFLSLGSNLGIREEYINKALALLKLNGVDLLKTSSILETEPVGGPGQGKYLNAVIKVQTQHSPEHLHFITQSIEIQLGRVRTVRNGPRVIDIDILLYDDLKLTAKNLIIPHPRMFERAFVMDPLKEIDPQLCASLKI